MVRLNNGIQSPSSFSQRKVFENHGGFVGARRDFNGLRFSKLILETGSGAWLSTRAPEWRLEKKSCPVKFLYQART